VTAAEGRFSLVAFLQFMLEAVERIMAYSDGLDSDSFQAETTRAAMVRDAVVFNLGVPGEAANDVRRHFPEAIEAMPEIPFARIHGMRNQIFHGYHTKTG
jgi:uncharacterized protein with HEPN domain